MIIEYKDGKRIITHQTGHVDTYDKAHYEKLLADEEIEAKELQASMIDTKNTIKAIDNSVKPKLLTRIRSKAKWYWEKTFG